MRKLWPLLLWAALACGGASSMPGGGSDGAADVLVLGDSAPRDSGPRCVPSCAGKTCGSDGCGGLCGACPATALCAASGACASIGGAGGGDPIQIDVAAVGPRIHDEVYGLAFASPLVLTQLNVPLNRWGGNSTTRYNWQLDVHNVGADYYFENIADQAGDTTYGTGSYVSSADSFVRSNLGANAATLMTIPTIGWTPKDRVEQHPFTCGFAVSKYGAQQSVDPYDANCGNGKAAVTAQQLTGDPADTSVAAPPSFEAAWVAHLAEPGRGVGFYQLDNEMNLWSSTHADVHPMPVTYDEVWQTTAAYAPVIRAADPGATILGYTSWGVLDLFESNLDSINGNNADQRAHGGLPLARWYLQKLASYEQQNGVRLVDCLDFHYYPQGGDPLANTASLWDPTYRDPSWIDSFLGEPVQLLPRLASWIAAEYPGTAICASEYNFNFGDPTDPAAALVEADVLGIFGKYGVRLGAYWTTPVDGSGALLPAAEAFRLYRNYDGAGSTFGAVSVGAASSIADLVAYAATDDAANVLTVVLINKTQAAQSPTAGIANFAPAAVARRWRWTAATGGQLAAAPDVPVSGGRLTVDLPARSMTLLAIARQ
jgi:hypothetical protein